MSTWSTDELRRLDQLSEIRVAGRRNDNTLRTLTIVWHVVVNDSLYVRSVRGTDGSWYKGAIRHHEGAIAFDGDTRNVTYVPDATADSQIDTAYFGKYGNGSSTRAITNAAARATTLRIEPR